MIFEPTFWGSQGRIGRISEGDLSGRFILVYPDTIPGWWTMIVEPSPYADRDGEDYTFGEKLVGSILDPMNIEWMELDETEADLERKLFSRRPLLGEVDWL